jgi:hypothetical protein
MNHRSPHAFVNLSNLWNSFSRGLLRSGEAMSESYELKVHLACDEETGRWYVAESDIPGLWLEADDPIALMGRIQTAAPELIDLNEDEILAACRARPSAAKPRARHAKPLRPSIMPVFDNPLALAYA